jgi:hypothetical protein
MAPRDRDPFSSSFRPKSPPPRRPAPALRSLRTLLARRRLACRQLGLRVPREIGDGPPETLAYRVATLDRWLGRTLDRAGGVRLLPGPGDEPPDLPADDPEDDEPGGWWAGKRS